MVRVTTALLLAALPAATLAASDDKKPTWPKINMAKFTATLISSDIVTGADPSSQIQKIVIVGDKSKALLLQGFFMADGRQQNSVLDYKGMINYQEQPFFNETVCYKLPLDGGGLGKKLKDSPQAQWMEGLYELLNLNDPVHEKWVKKGTKTVDGKTCTIYSNPQGKCCAQTVCVDGDGNILNSHFTQKEGGKRLETFDWTFSDFKSGSGNLTAPTGCVDLMGQKGPAGVDWERTAANDPELIRQANKEAAGLWIAGSSPVVEGMSLAQAAKRHGTRMAVPRLLPRSTELSVSHDAPIPAAFDARDHWKQCSSIGRIRNQGACGSCWAFGAAEVFADRLCIGGGPKNFSAGVEYMVDCSKNNQGCEGGYLDDAWEFLQKTGVPDEQCDGYKHCQNPADPQCKPTGPSPAPPPPGPPPAKLTCPSKCSNGKPLELKKLKSAYMVAKPGDVKGMQKEIMSDGPIEVAFFVYSDFDAYKSGIYFRTPSAQGPEGGHAVRILGWGTDKGTDYWLVANSWSPKWGEKGYFRIRRGTNECGIETIPTGGLADVAVNEIVV